MEERVRQGKKRKLKCGEQLTTFDIFGSQVTLTHNGEPKYKTRLGAGLTIFFICGIIGIGVDGFIKIHTAQIKSMSTEIR